MSPSRPESPSRSPLSRVQRQAGTLDAILGASTDMVYLCGRAGEFLYANPSGAAAWGLDRAEILGRSWSDLGIPSDVAATFDAQRSEVFETGRTIVDMMNLPSGIGERVYEYSLGPFRDGGADVEAVVLTLLDVTARRRAEETLRDREEKYRLLAENSTDMISRHDPLGVYLYASPSSRRLVGYEPDELVGRSAYDLIHPDDRDEVARFHSQVLATSDLFTVPYRVIRKDRSVIWLESTVRTVRNPWTGEVVAIHCSSRDTSGRRHAEEALRQGEERFRGAFEAAAIGIALVTPDGRWVRVNPALCEIVGYSHAELLGRTFQEISHPDDLDSDLRQMNQLLVGAIESYRMEKRYIHKEGFPVWILLSVSLVRDADGGPLYFVGLIEDISRRRRAEEQLREQNQRLETLVRSERQAHLTLKQAECQLVQAEKLTALGQLVAGLAHEINNPLAFVSNNIAVLRRDSALLRELLLMYQQADSNLSASDPDLHARIREFSERIDLRYTLDSLDRLTSRSTEGLRRIRQIVGDLRDFARLDESDISEVDLNDGIRSTVNLISGRARDQGIELVVDLGPLPPLTCSPGKLNQVVLNLLSNAIDATPAGGTVTVSTHAVATGEDPATATAPGPGIAIGINDTGPGIDPAIRDRIFDPFFTTKPVGKGTGLGLSLSYGIIRDHGGTIRVESLPDQGAHFTLFLPLTRPMPVQEPDERREPGPTRQTSD
jgi:two-component system, NtrC family, sensor kinase